MGRFLKIENPNNCAILYLGSAIYVSFYGKSAMKQPSINNLEHLFHWWQPYETVSITSLHMWDQEQKGWTDKPFSKDMFQVNAYSIHRAIMCNPERTATLLTALERILASCSWPLRSSKPLQATSIVCFCGRDCLILKHVFALVTFLPLPKQY